MARRAVFYLIGWAMAAGVLHASSVEIKHKARDLDKIKEELNRKRDEKEQLMREASQLSSELRAGETKVRNVEDSLLNTRRRTIAVEQDLATTKNTRDKLVTEIHTRREAALASFRTTYVASLVLDDAHPVPVYARHVTQVQASHLKGLVDSEAGTRTHLQDLVRMNQVLRGEIQKQESTLRNVRSGLEGKSRLLNKKLTRRDALEDEVRELEKTAEEVASLIDAMRTRAKKEEQKEREARLQKQMTGQSPIPRASLPWPARGKILTRFGRQQHPQLGTPFISNGLTLGVPVGEPVRAVADGRVLYTGQFMSYGLIALLEHPGDWYTVYGRLSKGNVEQGQDVKKGDAVGLSGARSGGGGEIYFELRFYGKPTDPMPWLAAD